MKKNIKKALSLFLSVLMIMTAWVFVAPTEAEAATAGSYKWRVRVVSENDTGGWNNEYFKVYGCKNNGTSSQTSSAIAQKDDWKVDFKGERTTTFGLGDQTTSEFPTKITYQYDFGGGTTWRELRFYMYLEVWNYNSNSWINIPLSMTRSSVSNTLNLGADGGSGGENEQRIQAKSSALSAAKGIITYTVNNKMPYASSVSEITGGSSSVSVPIDGTSTNYTSAFSTGTVKDQYGVNWYEDATLTVSSHSGVSISNNKVAVNSNANASENYNVTVTEKCGSASATTSVMINVFDYKVTFYDEDGTTVLLAEQTVDYNGTASAPSNPTKSYDSTNHYTFKEWTGDNYKNIKTGAQNKKVIASYTSTAHNLSVKKNSDNHWQECSGCAYSTTASGHIWNSGTITKQPTCTEAGVKTFTCTYAGCGATKTETVQSLGHDFTGVYKNASEGQHYRKCSRCDAYGINGEVNKTEACSGGTATCVEKAVCEHCNTAYGSVNPENHPEDKKEDKIEVPATCTTPGTSSGTYCNACKKWVSGGETIPAKGHDFSADAARVHSLNNGEHNFKCSRCDAYGAVVSGTNVKDASVACQYGAWTADTATCTEGGTKSHICDVCGYTETVETDELGHNWGAVSYTWAKDGDDWKCTATRICGRDSRHVETETVTASGRQTKEATCLDKGETTYTAEFENDAFNTQTKVVDDINAKGHDFSSTITKVNGDGTHSFKCVRCDAYGTGTTEGGKENCSGGTATCVSKATCSICHGEYGEVDPANHATELVKTEAKAATCIENGNIDYWYCASCKKYFKNEAGTDAIVKGETTENGGEVIKALGHELTHHEAKAPTCTTAGNIEYWTCSRCGKYFRDAAAQNEITAEQTGIAALNHKWDYANAVFNWDEENYTCETATVTCLNDSEHKDDVVVTVTSATTNPSCTENGATVYTAKFIAGGKEYTSQRTKVLPATGHNYDPNGSARYAGDKSHQYLCANGCNTWGFDGVEGATESCEDYYDYTIKSEATCTSKGYRTYECQVCRNTGEEEYPVLGHIMSKTEAKAATCVKEGNIEYYYCSRCGLYFRDEAGEYKLRVDETVDERVIAKLPHSYTGAVTDNGDGTHSIACVNGCDTVKTEEHTYGPGNVISTATCVSEGKTEYTCTVCGNVKIETTPAGGHAYRFVKWEWAEDYSKATAVIVCANDESHTDNQVVESSKVTVEPSCDSAGSETYTVSLTYGGQTYTDTKVKILPASAHNWRDIAPVFTWSENGTLADVTFECANCHEKRTFTATVETISSTPDTCTAAGVTIKSASYKFGDIEAYEEKTFTGTKLDHDFSKIVYNGDGTHSVVCAYDCGTVQSTEECTMTEWGNSTATCLTDGVESRHCTVCGHEETRPVTAPGKHTPSKPIYVAGKAATCTEDGYHFYNTICTVCGELLDSNKIIDKATGHKDVNPRDGYCDICGENVCTHSETVLVNKKDATCSSGGYTGDNICALCGVIVTKGKATSANASLHHAGDPVIKVRRAAATCTQNAYHDEEYYCVCCGQLLMSIQVVDKEATGHKDNDGDGKCDDCSTAIAATQKNCSHICHSNHWFTQIIWKIVRIFCKIFKINQTCACGVKHY